MDQFIKAVKGPLTKAMVDSKRLKPEIYARYVTGKQSPLQIVFVAIEGGKPTFSLTSFLGTIIKGKPTLTINRVGPVELTFMQPFSVTGAGNYELALEYFRTHEAAFLANPIPIIQEAAKTELSTRTVGGPFSLMQFDSAGTKWITNGECK
jgi:hypothetical protein